MVNCGHDRDGVKAAKTLSNRADMGRSVLRPYMICDVYRAGLEGWCSVQEADGGKVAAGILHMML